MNPAANIRIEMLFPASKGRASKGRRKQVLRKFEL
jgi:hypothetical protein